MGFFSRVLSPRADAGRGPLDDYWYQPLGMLSASGVAVTPETAMKLSAVWRCRQIISGSVAMLPLSIYTRRLDGGKDIARNHPLYEVLHDQPNRWQTAYEWREMTQGHVLMRGNAYSQIIPGPRGFADQLRPIHPDAVTPEQQTDGSIKYRVRNGAGKVQTLFDDEVFHLRGLSDDGVTGLDVLTYARNSMGLGLAQEAYGARFFKQGSTPPGVLLAKGRLKPETQTHIADSWMGATAGENQHRWPVLEEGFDIKQLAVGLTAEQAQLVESRAYTTADVARWFGVPNHMIGETSGETSWGSGIEQLSIGFVIFTLLPWLRRWEQRVSHSLILNTRSFFAEHNVDALLRGDTKTRYEAYQIAAGGNAPWMSRNEIRALENLNPRPGLDDMLAPMNMSGASGSGGPPAGGDDDDEGESARNLSGRELLDLAEARIMSAGGVSR